MRKNSGTLRCKLDSRSFCDLSVLLLPLSEKLLCLRYKLASS